MGYRSAPAVNPSLPRCRGRMLRIPIQRPVSAIYHAEMADDFPEFFTALDFLRMQKSDFLRHRTLGENRRTPLRSGYGRPIAFRLRARGAPKVHRTARISH